MSAIQRLREDLEANGADLSGYTDTQLTQEFGNYLRGTGKKLSYGGESFKDDYLNIINQPEVGREGLLGTAKEIPAGLNRGFQGLMSVGLGGLGLASDYIPGEWSDPYLRDPLMARAAERQRKASEGGPSIERFTDVRNPREFGRWFMGAMGEVFPSLAESGVAALAGGGVGGIVGKQVAKKNIKEAVEERVGKKVKDLTEDQFKKEFDDILIGAGREGARKGQLAGVGLSSVEMGMGEVYTSLYPYTQLDESDDDYVSPARARTLSLMGGIAIGSLDSVVPMSLLKKFGLPATEGTQKKVIEYLADIMGSVGSEAGTESLQEYINIAAEKIAHGESATLTDEDRLRLIDAGALGAVGGIGFGAPSAALEYYRGKLDDTKNLPEEEASDLEIDDAVEQETNRKILDIIEGLSTKNEEEVKGLDVGESVRVYDRTQKSIKYGERGEIQEHLSDGRVRVKVGNEILEVPAGMLTPAPRFDPKIEKVPEPRVITTIGEDQRKRDTKVSKIKAWPAKANIGRDLTPAEAKVFKEAYKIADEYGLPVTWGDAEGKSHTVMPPEVNDQGRYEFDVGGKKKKLTTQTHLVGKLEQFINELAPEYEKLPSKEITYDKVLGDLEIDTVDHGTFKGYLRDLGYFNKKSGRYGRTLRDDEIRTEQQEEAARQILKAQEDARINNFNVGDIVSFSHEDEIRHGSVAYIAQGDTDQRRGTIRVEFEGKSYKISKDIAPDDAKSRLRKASDTVLQKFKGLEEVKKEIGEKRIIKNTSEEIEVTDVIVGHRGAYYYRYQSGKEILSVRKSDTSIKKEKRPPRKTPTNPWLTERPVDLYLWSIFTKKNGESRTYKKPSLSAYNTLQEDINQSREEGNEVKVSVYFEKINEGKHKGRYQIRYQHPEVAPSRLILSKIDESVFTDPDEVTAELPVYREVSGRKLKNSDFTASSWKEIAQRFANIRNDAKSGEKPESVTFVITKGLQSYQITARALTDNTFRFGDERGSEITLGDIPGTQYEYEKIDVLYDKERDTHVQNLRDIISRALESSGVLPTRHIAQMNLAFIREHGHPGARTVEEDSEIRRDVLSLLGQDHEAFRERDQSLSNQMNSYAADFAAWAQPVVTLEDINNESNWERTVPKDGKNADGYIYKGYQIIDSGSHIKGGRWSVVDETFDRLKDAKQFIEDQTATTDQGEKQDFGEWKYNFGPSGKPILKGESTVVRRWGKTNVFEEATIEIRKKANNRWQFRVIPGDTTGGATVSETSWDGEFTTKRSAFETAFANMRKASKESYEAIPSGVSKLTEDDKVTGAVKFNGKVKASYNPDTKKIVFSGIQVANMKRDEDDQRVILTLPHKAIHTVSYDYSSGAVAEIKMRDMLLNLRQPMLDTEKISTEQKEYLQSNKRTTLLEFRSGEKVELRKLSAAKVRDTKVLIKEGDKLVEKTAKTATVGGRQGRGTTSDVNPYIFIEGGVPIGSNTSLPVTKDGIGQLKDTIDSYMQLANDKQKEILSEASERLERWSNDRDPFTLTGKITINSSWDKGMIEVTSDGFNDLFEGKEQTKLTASSYRKDQTVSEAAALLFGGDVNPDVKIEKSTVDYTSNIPSWESVKDNDTPPLRALLHRWQNANLEQVIWDWVNQQELGKHYRYESNIVTEHLKQEGLDNTGIDATDLDNSIKKHFAWKMAVDNGLEGTGSKWGDHDALVDLYKSLLTEDGRIRVQDQDVVRDILSQAEEVGVGEWVQQIYQAYIGNNDLNVKNAKGNDPAMNWAKSGLEIAFRPLSNDKVINLVKTKGQKIRDLVGNINDNDISSIFTIVASYGKNPTAQKVRSLLNAIAGFQLDFSEPVTDIPTHLGAVFSNARWRANGGRDSRLSKKLTESKKDLDGANYMSILKDVINAASDITGAKIKGLDTLAQLTTIKDEIKGSEATEGREAWAGSTSEGSPLTAESPARKSFSQAPIDMNTGMSVGVEVVTDEDSDNMDSQQAIHSGPLQVTEVEQANQEVIQGNLEAIASLGASIGGNLPAMSYFRTIDELINSGRIRLSREVIDIYTQLKRSPALSGVNVRYATESELQSAQPTYEKGMVTQAWYDPSRREIVLSQLFRLDSNQDALSELAGRFIHEALEASMVEAHKLARNLRREVNSSNGVTAKDYGLSDKQYLKIFDDLRTLYQISKKQGESGNNSNWYGLTSESEFIAELGSNPRFRKFLNGIRLTNAQRRQLGLGNKGFIRTALDAILAFFYRLMGREATPGTVLSEGLVNLKEMLNWQTTRTRDLGGGRLSVSRALWDVLKSDYPSVTWEDFKNLHGERDFFGMSPLDSNQPGFIGLRALGQIKEVSGGAGSLRGMRAGIEAALRQYPDTPMVSSPEENLQSILSDNGFIRIEAEDLKGIQQHTKEVIRQDSELADILDANTAVYVNEAFLRAATEGVPAGLLPKSVIGKLQMAQGPASAPVLQEGNFVLVEGEIQRDTGGAGTIYNNPVYSIRLTDTEGSLSPELLISEEQANSLLTIEGTGQVFVDTGLRKEIDEEEYIYHISWNGQNLNRMWIEADMLTGYEPVKFSQTALPQADANVLAAKKAQAAANNVVRDIDEKLLPRLAEIMGEELDINQANKEFFGGIHGSGSVGTRSTTSEDPQGRGYAQSKVEKVLSDLRSKYGDDVANATLGGLGRNPALIARARRLMIKLASGRASHAELRIADEMNRRAKDEMALERINELLESLQEPDGILQAGNHSKSIFNRMKDALVRLGADSSRVASEVKDSGVDISGLDEAIRLAEEAENSIDIVQAVAALDADFENIESLRTAIYEAAQTDQTLSIFRDNLLLQHMLARTFVKNGSLVDMVRIATNKQGGQQSAVKEIKDALETSLPTLEGIRDTLKGDPILKAKGRIVDARVKKRDLENSIARSRLAVEAHRAVSEQYQEIYKQVGAELGQADMFEMYDGSKMTHAQQDKETGEWSIGEFTIAMKGTEVMDSKALNDVIRDNERWLKEHGSMKGDPAYETIRIYTERSKARVVRNIYGSARSMLPGRILESLQHKLRRFGPAGTYMAQMFNGLQRMLLEHGADIDAKARRVNQRIDDISKYLGLTPKSWYNFSHNLVFDWLQNNPQYDNNEAALKGLVKFLREHGMGGVDPARLNNEAFVRKLRNMLVANANLNLEYLKINSRYGAKVEDRFDVLSIFHQTPDWDSMTKEEVAEQVKKMKGGLQGQKLLRDPVELGSFTTMPRRINSRALNLAVTEIKNIRNKIGEFGVIDEISDEAAFAEAMNMILTDNMVSFVLEPFLTSASIQEFWSGPEKEQMLANSEVARAWRESGTGVAGVMEMLDRLYTENTAFVSEDPDMIAQDKLKWYKKFMGNFISHTKRLEKLDEDSRRKRGIFHLSDNSADVIAHARSDMAIPWEFFNYQALDEQSSRIHLAHVVANINFGRDNRMLEESFNSLEEEISSKRDEYLAYVARITGKPAYDPENKSEVKSLLTFGRSKKIMKQVAAEVGSEKAKELFDAAALWEDFGGSNFGVKTMIRALLASTDNVFKDTALMDDVLRFIAFGMVNKPTTGAMSWLSLTELMNFYGGFNRKSARALATAFLKGSGAMMKGMIPALGKELDQVSRVESSILQLPRAQLDTRDAIRTHGIRGEFTGPDGKRISGILRRILSGMTHSKSKGGGVPFGPRTMFTNAFNWLTQGATYGIAEGMIDATSVYVKEVADLIEAQGIKEGKEVTASMMGFGGAMDRAIWGNKDGFDRVNRALEGYGVGSLTYLAREYLSRKADGDTKVLNEDAQMAVAQMGIAEISFDGPGGRAALLFGDNLASRISRPLLGWSLSAVQRLGTRFQTGEDRLDAYSLIKGSLMMSCWFAPVGMVAAAMLDEYDEEVLGKPSNYQKVSPQSMLPFGFMLTEDPRAEFIAGLERLARTGTTGGMGAEAIAAIASMSDPSMGPKNMTLDSRVFGWAILQNLRKSVSNFVHSGGRMDFRLVVQPSIYALGGSSVMHYSQMASNLIPYVDEVPFFSQVRAAADYTGMRNSIRSSSRYLGLELRPSMAGSNMRTTPFAVAMRNMELAAYSDNRDLFNEQYQIALSEAKKRGKASPRKYVASQFKTRRINNGITARAMDEQDWQGILRMQSPEMQQKMKHAMRMHGKYLGYIYTPSTRSNRSTLSYGTLSLGGYGRL